MQSSESTAYSGTAPASYGAGHGQKDTQGQGTGMMVGDGFQKLSSVTDSDIIKDHSSVQEDAPFTSLLCDVDVGECRGLYFTL